MEWIAEVEFHPNVAHKISQRRNGPVTPDEVREAVLFGHAEEARWHTHPKHGRRLLVIGRPYHRRYRVFVVLMPVDRANGKWRCKTAMRWNR